MAYVFEGLVLDAERYELCRGPTPLKAEPKVLELLLHLVRERGRLVSHDELRGALWRNVHVGSSSLTRCIAAARRLVGDDPRQQRLIKTVYGRGYRFHAAVRETQPAPASGGEAGPLPFVGRRHELGRLRAAAGEAFAGSGALIALVGEKGIGKTRTAEELAVWARRRGVRVLWGECREEEGAPGFWPWIQIVRSALEKDGETLRAWLLDQAPELARLLPELAVVSAGGDGGADTSRERFLVFDGMERFLGRTARGEALLIAIDDVDRGDLGSLRLLRFLAPTLHRMRVVILVTLRDLEPAGRSSRTYAISDVLRQTRALCVQLPALSASEIEELVRATGAEIDEARARALRDRTGGNPFFLSRLLPLLPLEGHSTPTDVPRRLPSDVREAIRQQLGRVAPPTRRVLEVAAILGSEFSFSELREATGSAGHTLLRRLDPALRAGLVLESSGQGRPYRFAHGLVRETLCDDVGAARRAQFHLRTGRALARVHRRRLDPHLAKLAHHFCEAAALGGAARAIRYAVAAARYSEAHCAFEEAASLLGRALHVMDTYAEDDLAARLQLLVALCRARVLAEDGSGAREAFERGVALARSLGDREQLARLGLAFSPALLFVPPFWIDERRVIEVLEESIVPPSLTSALRARVLARLASWHCDAGARRRLSDAALRAAERSRRPEAICFARLGRIVALWGPDGLKARLREIPAAIAEAEAADEREVSLVLRNFWVTALLEAGDVASADCEIARFGRIARELRHPRALAHHANQESTRALMQGRFDRVEELTREARETAERVGDALSFFGLSVKSQFCRLERDGGADPRPPLAALRLAAAARPELLEYQCGLVGVHAEFGRMKEAALALRRVTVRELEEAPRTANWLLATVGLAEACTDLGDARRGAVLHDLLTPYAAHYTVPGPHPFFYFGAVSRSLGRLAVLLGQWRSAEAHFGMALEMEQRVAAWPWLARAQDEFARMLLARGGASDRGRAAELVSAALALCCELGLGRRERRLLRLKAGKLGSGVRRVSPRRGSRASSPS